MRYFFVGFVAVLSKAITFRVAGCCGCTAAALLVDPFPAPQPCAAKAEAATTTVTAATASDCGPLRSLLKISAPPSRRRRRVLAPGRYPIPGRPSGRSSNRLEPIFHSELGLAAQRARSFESDPATGPGQWFTPS